MPKIINPNSQDTCFYCNGPALFISVNSKQKRCQEKVTRCPGFVAKAEKSRRQNLSGEKLSEHMKKLSKKGNSRLRELHQDPEWINQKSTRIKKRVEERGGHLGANNPMFGNRHSDETKKLLSQRAQDRDPSCYIAATHTKIKRGIATPKHLKTDWEAYREKVLNYTRTSWIKHQYLINPNGYIRGKHYELDHKFSITEGFNNNVPPDIIGHYLNLELMPKNINRTKRTKCSITLEELYFAINSI